MNAITISIVALDSYEGISAPTVDAELQAELEH
jgi:hypothetical protein